MSSQDCKRIKDDFNLFQGKLKLGRLPQTVSLQWMLKRVAAFTSQQPASHEGNEQNPGI